MAPSRGRTSPRGSRRAIARISREALCSSTFRRLSTRFAASPGHVASNPRRVPRASALPTASSRFPVTLPQPFRTCGKLRPCGNGDAHDNEARRPRSRGTEAAPPRIGRACLRDYFPAWRRTRRSRTLGRQSLPLATPRSNRVLFSQYRRKRLSRGCGRVWRDVLVAPRGGRRPRIGPGFLSRCRGRRGRKALPGRVRAGDEAARREPGIRYADEPGPPDLPAQDLPVRGRLPGAGFDHPGAGLTAPAPASEVRRSSPVNRLSRGRTEQDGRHFTRMPGTAPASDVMRKMPGPWSPLAARIMPSLMPNFILRGARFATITVKRPSSVAGS